MIYLKKYKKMQFKKVIFIFALLFCFWLTELYAQKAILASGGNISSRTGSVCYSVGQMIYNTRTNVNITQPVKKVNLTVVPVTNKVKSINIRCSIYPNPTSNYFSLKIENFEKENFTYQLVDINGKLFESKKVENNETIIDVIKLIPAIYFLKVIQKNLGVKTFKIIKE